MKYMMIIGGIVLVVAYEGNIFTLHSIVLFV